MMLRASALALLLAVGATGIAHAERVTPSDWMPAEQVRQKVLAAGYSSVGELEPEGRYWSGEGTKRGVRMDFRADPKTGVIVSENPDGDD